jgi:ClpP class serine protease
MEPIQAQHYASVAEKVFSTGSMPAIDKRNYYTDKTWEGELLDTGPTFRVNEKGAVDKAGAIQVFHITGPIAKYDFCGSPGTQTFSQLLTAAYADETVKACLLWSDTPGGQVDGTENLAQTVKQRNKPVITYVDGMLCSAGYWIGSSADEIIVNGANNGFNATIGSIGTMCQFIDDSANLEKEGYKRHLVFADASSDKWGDFFAAQKGDYSAMKKTLNGINDSFLSAVKVNREGKLQLDKENVLSGKTYNANEAITYGLVDKKGDFGFAVKRAVTLSKKYSQQQKATMNTEATAFEKTLIAAEAASFQVVDGGFLLTEDQLNKIESTLKQQATVVATMTERVDTLQSSADASANSVQALADANNLNADLQKQLATLTTEKDTLAQQVADFNEGKSLFTNTKAPKGDKPEASEEEVLIDELAHNKLADSLGLGKPVTA